MKKLAGIALFLVILYIAVLLGSEGARSLQNHVNLGRRIGSLGIISLGAGILIVSGGIDLSIGSVIALSATIVVVLTKEGLPPIVAVAAALCTGLVIGLFHGIVVTYLRIQAFVVTLCGLFIYRGLARYLANDQNQSLPREEFLDWIAWLYKHPEMPSVPMSLVVLCCVALVAAGMMHLSVHGRWLAAIGSNEKAARYSGIPTHRYKIVAYMICSGLASFYAVMFLMDNNQVQASSDGNFFELYAIAGAVLGGCSLRGGEGTVLGIMIGTAILCLLRNFVNMWGISTSHEFTVIGSALLCGAILDELLRRGAARQR